jgi:hypothetical protein
MILNRRGVSSLRATRIRATRIRATRIACLFAAATVTLIVSGCSTGDQKQYDIAPIFPLSADKCATYHGDETGEGFNASCMVTKAECERAAADWRQAMRDSGVNDAIQFSCT